MKKALLLSILCLVCLVGCSAEQLQKADELAAKTQTVVTAAATAVESPAGELIPQPFKAYVQVGLIAAGILAAGWREFRKLKTVTKSIVTAIELAGTAGDVVKPLVAQQLDQVKLYEQGKSIISALKPTMTAATAEQKQAA